MNSRIVIFSILATAALCCPPAARASLNFQTVLRDIYQLGAGSSAVSLGHTVVAGTNLNRLTAGGSFNASCASTFTGSIPGERTLTSALVAQYNQLYVTIPAQFPAVLNMPGFELVPAGSILSCTYAWTSRAQESTYTIGIPGLGITIGGEERRDGSSVGFQMVQSFGGDEPSHGCLP
jgi:hypothetical protein